MSVRGLRGRPRNMAGQALALVLCSVSIIVVIAVAVSHFGVRLLERSRAQSAADAAALAGLSYGRGRAEAIATANGAHLVFWSGEGDVCTVRVTYGAATATARASRQGNERARPLATGSAFYTYRSWATTISGETKGRTRSSPLLGGWRSRSPPRRRLPSLPSG